MTATEKREPIRRPEDLGPEHQVLKALLKNECFGAGRARSEVHIRQMMAERGWPTTTRDLFYLVQDLRLCGEPIGSGAGGYFWPATREEFARVVSFYAARFRILRETTETMKGVLDHWRAEPHPAQPPQQGRLFEAAGQKA
ncbi:MAG TPA: hypothetical protein VMY35_14835 [Phycisphaerae bacterium]|nr:hypothetical protein [Phycisphaerae bacterium]